MAFPVTNSFFRTPFYTGITTPVALGNATGTLRIAHALVELRFYTNTLDWATGGNFDTIGVMTTAPLNANECASSGNYLSARTPGNTNGMTWDFTPTLTKGTAAAGGTMYLGKTGATSTATAAVIATVGGAVTWAGGAGAQGVILHDNSATITAAFPMASFLFSAVLNPAGGPVTVTFSNGLMTIG